MCWALRAPRQAPCAAWPTPPRCEAAALLFCCRSERPRQRPSCGARRYAPRRPRCRGASWPRPRRAGARGSCYKSPASRAASAGLRRCSPSLQVERPCRPRLVRGPRASRARRYLGAAALPPVPTRPASPRAPAPCAGNPMSVACRCFSNSSQAPRFFAVPLELFFIRGCITSEHFRAISASTSACLSSESSSDIRAPARRKALPCDAALAQRIAQVWPQKIGRCAAGDEYDRVQRR